MRDYITTNHVYILDFASSDLLNLRATRAEGESIEYRFVRSDSLCFNNEKMIDVLNCYKSENKR